MIRWRDIVKGRTYPVGTRRRHGKVMKEKQPDGSWSPVKEKPAKKHGADFDFDAFGFDVEPTEHTTADKIQAEIGGMPAHKSIEGLLTSRAAKLLKEPRIRYWQPTPHSQGAWAVSVKASSKADAIKQGKVVQGSLTGVRSLKAADPHLHHRPLYVEYSGGFVKIEGLPKRAKDTSTRDAKAKILRVGRGFFGSSGVSLTGSEGKYTVMVRPVLKEHRGKFSATRITATSLSEALTKLQTMIEAARRLI